MESMAIMAVISLVSTLVGSFVSEHQQQSEFEQQNKLLQSQQDFQRERDDVLWQRENPKQYYSDLRDLGINPQSIAASILGGNSESAHPASSPAASPVNSAINALQNSIGQGGKNLYDIYLNHLQGENIKANTEKTEIESGIIPRDYELRRMSTLKQLEVWDASVKKMTSEVGYNEEMTKLVENQNLYYGRMSEAQIKSYEEQTNLAIQKCKESAARIEQMQHQNENIDAETELTRATTSNVIQDTSLKFTQTSTEFERSERERIAKEFEINNNAPLTAAGADKVRALLRDGKYDEVQEFYNVIFRSALNQQLGTAFGTPTKQQFKTPFSLEEYYNLQPSYLNRTIWNFNPYRGASKSF